MLIRLLAVICCKPCFWARQDGIYRRRSEWIYSGVDSLSPNGRFAVLYPVRGENDAELPPNLLVCLAVFDSAKLVRRAGDGGRVTSR